MYPLFQGKGTHLLKFPLFSDRNVPIRNVPNYRTEIGVRKVARWHRSRFFLRRPLYFPRTSKYVFVLVSLVLIALLLFVIIEKNLKPTIIKIAETRAHLIATETIHRVLFEKVLTNVDYNDLVFIHKDAQQRITMMQANTIRISRIISQANLEIKQALESLKEKSFTIPLGQTLGSKLLANYGPGITVKIMPIGSVNVNFIDKFQEAGINQVRHILYLDIETTVKIVVPLTTEGVTVSNQIPIAETIIVGEVPSTYFNVKLAQ